MIELLQSLQPIILAISTWELVAVVLAIAYLVLTIRQHLACWAAAIGSAGIYTVLMFNAGLYMESLLQLFYIAMAIYGWRHWASGGEGHRPLPITDWPLAFHTLPVLTIVLLSLTSGYLLENFSAAAFPYVDSFTTWGAIVTTWMVARKVLQNWHYWFVIDSVSVYLYMQRGLYLTALLFVGYLLLIFVGYRAWHRALRKRYA